MKRARFQERVLGGEEPLVRWRRLVLEERRGEAPYELLCAWRRAWGVPKSVPYITTAIVCNKRTDGFVLRDVHTRAVLLYARGHLVTLYDEGERELAYDYRAQDRWPWTPVAFACCFGDLPADVWQHFAARVAPEDIVVELARAPLSKRWMTMWAGERFARLWHDKNKRVSPSLLPSIQRNAERVPPLVKLRRVLDYTRWWMRQRDVFSRRTRPILIAILNKLLQDDIPKFITVDGSATQLRMSANAVWVQAGFGHDGSPTIQCTTAFDGNLLKWIDTASDAFCFLIK